MPLKIPTVQTGLEQSIRKAVNNVSRRGGLNLNLKKYEISYGININSQSLGEPQILSLKFHLP